MKEEDQDLSTNGYERSPTPDKLEWGCKINPTGTHRHVGVGLNNTSENMEQTGTWVHQVARAMEEQLREEKQDLKTREQKKKAKDAKKIREIVHEKKGTIHVRDEMGKLMHNDEQELLSLWEGRHWDDNKGGWLDPKPCAKARRQEVECIRRHKMYTRVARETCLRETGKAPIKTWSDIEGFSCGSKILLGRQ